MMEERRALDVYRRAEQSLTAMAAAIQRQDPLEITELSALAKEVADSMARNDQLVVQALAGPTGSTLITNLINVVFWPRRWARAWGITAKNFTG